MASGAANYGDGASIEELHRLLSRFEAFVTEATAAFEAGEEWAADGAKTASAWLATRCRLPRGAARRRVRLGRALRHLPECAEAWREGAIGLDAGPGHRLGEAAPHRVRHGPRRGDARRPGRGDGLRGLLPGLELLEAAGRPRRGRRRRGGPQGRPQRVLRSQLHRDVAGPDDPRPGLGLHRLGRAQPPRARPLRGRLRRGQRTPGAPGPPRRAGPHLGAAPGRRPRRDGHAQRQRPGRRHPPRPALLCLRRL